MLSQRIYKQCILLYWDKLQEIYNIGDTHSVKFYDRWLWKIKSSSYSKSHHICSCRTNTFVVIFWYGLHKILTLLMKEKMIMFRFLLKLYKKCNTVLLLPNNFYFCVNKQFVIIKSHLVFVSIWISKSPASYGFLLKRHFYMIIECL